MTGGANNRANPAKLAGRCSNLYFTIGLVLIAMAARPGLAELPAARLSYIFPPGGQAGTSVNVTVTGADLDGAAELRFSRPGISATLADESQGGTERTFKVVIDCGTPVGECEVRIAGPYGVSNPRAFCIGDRPETVANPLKPDERRRLALGSVVNARCAKDAVDSYDIELLQGQRLFFTCATREIDSRLSPVMTLLDADRHELERSRRGGLIDFTVPADGIYTLQLHDLLYHGGPDFFYRLEVGTGPHLDAIFPPAGRSGSREKYILLGRNLPGGRKSALRSSDGKPLEELDVAIQLPEHVGDTLDSLARTGISGWTTSAFAFRLPTENGLSNPVLIGPTQSPVLQEPEPNDDPARAQHVELPVEVVGRFYPHSQRNWLTFDAVQGEEFWIEMCCQRMGLPSNPFILVQRVAGSGHEENVTDILEISGVDANPLGPTIRTASRDGAARLQIPQTGTYRLLVRDLFDTTRDDPSLTYHLSIRRPQPDFRLLALPVAGENNDVGIWSPFLRRDGAVPLRLLLARQDGFNGAVRIEVEGLPADVNCVGTTIPPGQNTGTLVLSAGDHAGDWCGPARIIARADVNHKQISHEARMGMVVWPGNQNAQEPAVTRLAEDFVLAVNGEEREPVSFEVSETSFEVPVGGKVRIALKVRRNLPVNGPIKISPAVVTSPNIVKELTLTPEACQGALDIDLSQLKVPPGAYSFVLKAQAQVTYQRRSFPANASRDSGKTTPQNLQTTSYSPLLTLNVTPQGNAKEKK
jgi:hypothetical protein